jgi:hypothetical protein
MSEYGFQSIRVSTQDPKHFQCQRCKCEVKLSQIAAFIRLSPQDPFEAWCHGCMLVLVSAARVGMDLADQVLRS